MGVYNHHLYSQAQPARKTFYPHRPCGQESCRHRRCPFSPPLPSFLGFSIPMFQLFTMLDFHRILPPTHALALSACRFVKIPWEIRTCDLDHNSYEGYHRTTGYPIIDYTHTAVLQEVIALFCGGGGGIGKKRIWLKSNCFQHSIFGIAGDPIINNHHSGGLADGNTRQQLPTYEKAQKSHSLRKRSRSTRFG